MVKEFDIFFIGAADERQPVINLVFGDRGAVVKVWEHSGNCFGFGAWIDNPGKDKLGYHIIYIELKAHLSSQDVNDFSDVQLF